jgi:mono/diheme cytochrome c family protein
MNLNSFEGASSPHPARSYTSHSLPARAHACVPGWSGNCIVAGMPSATRRVRIAYIALLVSCGFAACSHASGAQRELSAPSPHYVERVQQARASGHSERFQALMSEHFGFAAWARDATSIGDVDSAREALLNLASHANEGSVPGVWLPRVRALADDARSAADATTIEGLANGVAQIGRACGECHAATGGGPAVSTPAWQASEQGPDTFPDRMFRHRNAIEQLWLGLVAPSTALWNRGAAELAHASSDVRVEGVLPASYEHAFRNLQDLGRQALSGGTPDERAQSYARVLGACADCHTRPAPAAL